MRRFEEKIVVITGAATGIGEASAIRFAAEGAKVACLDNNDSDNEASAATIIQAGGEAIAISCDVGSREAQASAFAQVVDKWGRVDVLVTSAGEYAGGPLADIPVDRWQQILATNLSGILYSNSVVAPTMIAQGSGAIINISSMAGKTSWPESAEYSATKSGVIGITRSAAMELGPHNVTVNAVCPGNTRTAMVERVAVEIGQTMNMTGPEWLKMRAKDTALKRLAEPSEIAGVLAFLASDDARYITGQAIEVDGGLVLA